MIKHLLLATALCTHMGSTLAQATNGDKASPKKALVAKILVLQQPNLDNMARGMIEQPAAQLMQQVSIAVRQRVPEDKREELGREVQADVKKYIDETLPIVRDSASRLAPSTVGAVLEERFSVEELKQIIALLESPLNRKYQAAGADMQRALTEKLVAESRASVQAKFQALEQSVGKRVAPYMGASGAASGAGK